MDRSMISPAYSYRDDATVPAFDDTKPLIIFDGLCVLCTWGVKFMMLYDPKGTSRFASIQDPVARAIYRHYGLDPDKFDTFMVMKEGRPYIKWAGVAAAARTMPFPWSALGFLAGILPRFAGDPLYDYIQRNRLRWFGSRDQCMVPDPEQRKRLL